MNILLINILFVGFKVSESVRIRLFYPILYIYIYIYIILQIAMPRNTRITQINHISEVS